MKTLSLQQPYALVGVMGIKPWETRPRPTKFRGRHLIAASENWKKEYREVMEQDVFKVATLGKEIYLGGIIGSAEITDCCSTLEAVTRMAKDVSDGKIEKWEMERALCFGNFEAGRFAYKWEKAIEFEKPIPCKGALGFWDTRNQRGSYKIEPEELPYLESHSLYYLGEFVSNGTEEKLNVLIGNGIQGHWPPMVEDTIDLIEKRLFKL